MMNSQHLSLIDIGSNTIRLVVFQVSAHYSISELQNVKIPARLFEYLEDDVLNEEGVALLLRILRTLKKISVSYDPEQTFYVATAAIRRSKNRQEILDRVKEELDIDIRILSDKEEAFYGNFAVRYTFSYQDGLTVDIGGGSTELVLFEDGEIREMISLPFGAVSLAEQFFEGKDHQNTDAVEDTCDYIQSVFKELDWLKKLNLPIIGIGGSARNVAEVYLRQTAYPLAGNHGFSLDPSMIEEVLDLFLSSSKKDMKDIDGLSSERVDTIVPATLVFQELLKVTKSDKFVISGVGLREGVIMDYINATHHHPYSSEDVPGQMVVRTARKYRIPSVSVNQRVVIANQLLSQLLAFDLLELTKSEKQMFYYANVLYFMGSFIEEESASQHTFYVLSNMNLFGFSHKERVALAILASFKNKSLFKQYMADFDDWFSDQEKNTLLLLGSVIRFTEALNDTHINRIHQLNIEKIDDKNYHLDVTFQGDALSEQYRADKQKNHLERVLQGDLSIRFHSLENGDC